MSRKIDATIQTEDSRSAWVNHSIEDFTCPVTQFLFFDPVIACNPSATCGHSFEKKLSVGKLQKCPCCQQDITLFSPALHTKNTLDEILLAHPELWRDVYFNLDHFAEVFTQENGLKTQNGIRFIRLLEHSSNHLNDKAIEGAQKNKSAIEILASTLAGRDFLRKKLRIDTPSGKFFFGRAEILPASLMIQTNGKSIREWLSMTTAMEKFEKGALERMSAIAEEERIITAQKERLSNHQFRLFLSRGAQGASSAASDDRVSAELQPLLKAAFGADLDGVKRIIEETRTEDRSALLSTPASANYSETEIHIDTAFKAALATADEAMAVEIAQYLDPTEIAGQFKNVFGPDYAAFLKQQEKEAESLFEGLEAAFNGATPTEVQNALNQVPNTSSALQLKITEFKTKLEDYVNKTRPLHNDFILAKAYEIYDKNWSPWTGDQLCLFSQPVIGVIQASTLKTSTKRSMDIAEGIYNRAINIDKGMPARRSLFLAGSTIDVRSVDDLGSRSCIDIGGRAWGLPRRAWRGPRGASVVFTKIVSSKHISFGKLMQRSKSHQSRTRPGCSVM